MRTVEPLISEEEREVVELRFDGDDDVDVDVDDDVDDDEKNRMTGMMLIANSDDKEHPMNNDNHNSTNAENIPMTPKKKKMTSLQPSLHMRCADGWHRFYWILYPSIHDYHVTTIHSFSLHRSATAQHPIQLGWFYVNHLETHARMLQCDCKHSE